MLAGIVYLCKLMTHDRITTILKMLMIIIAKIFMILIAPVCLIDFFWNFSLGYPECPTFSLLSHLLL